MTAQEKQAREFLKGCEHDGSFIPVNEVIKLMIDFADQPNLTQCHNCGEMVEMIVTGEICPVCKCDN